MTAHGAGGYGSISAQLELARKELIHAVLVHDQHDQVNGLSTDLEAPTSTDDFERRGSAPAVSRAARGRAFAVLGANDKATLLHRRGNGHANRGLHDLLRDSLVRRRHDFIQNVG